jgi:hypothetical protein
MSKKLPQAFFAYPSTRPTLKEAIGGFMRDINQGDNARVQSWEQCSVGGKLIIQEICRAIDSCSMFFADLTGLNANVMFELGYAIARDKRIWLVLDTSLEKQQKMFEQLRLLTTVGYAPCLNSEQMVTCFHADSPFADLNTTIYKETIEPSLRDRAGASIVYLKSRHATEASIAITKAVHAARCSVVVDDPQESTVRTLAWYGEQVANAAGVLCHLTSPDREGSRLESAKYSLVAGLAFGLGKKLLMLAEGDYLAPVDYRDLLKHYGRSTEATAYADEWIAPIDASELKVREERGDRLTKARLATELKGLRFGDYVAENETEMLTDQYFVSTAAYEDALRGACSLFVGRKGSGKTANLLKVAQELQGDRRNLICQIKPAAYEMQGIVELLRRYRQRDTKGYAIASLWKYLLYSEVARTAAARLEDRPSATHGAPEADYLRYVDDHADLVRPEFSVRLERCVARLLSDPAATGGIDVEATRTAISETLHGGILSGLKSQIAIVLQDLERIVILVDNLDKAWDKASDFEVLAEVLLGLLGAASDIPQDLGRQGRRRKSVRVNLVAFLRSDIFYKVRECAREPDKISYSRLEWDDRDLLKRVIEERFVAGHDGDVSPDDLWTRYFCEEVAGRPTSDYLLDVILARPRDLIYLMNAAVATAVNRKHTRVEPDDILEAERQYSLYALESLVVENTLPAIDLESVLFEFVGSRSVVTQNELREILAGAGIDADMFDEMVKILCGLTFLGIEIGEDRFAFGEDPQRYRRNEVQARRYSERRGQLRRYKVHPAFRAFLEITNGGEPEEAG